jgi:serine/threonine-protein phosphatase 2A regulatory subunit A
LLSQSLLPAVVDLAEDRQWRVRLAIIEAMPLLAEQLGVNFFDQKLCGLCKDWLGDNVFSIREAAALNLLKLTQVFGCEWAQSHLIPQVLDIQSHANYLHRLTSLIAIKVLAEAFQGEVLQTLLLPPVLRMAEDPVPNIRFNVCKTLKELVPKVDSTTMNAQIKPVLTGMAQDADRDVKFFANQALTVCR